MGGTTSRPDAARRNVKARITILGTDKQPLKQQALVRITSQDNGRVYFEITRDKEAIFSNLSPGKYLIEIGAAGYVAKHEDFNIPDLDFDFNETVYLVRDPAAVNLSLGDENLPGKARKAAEKGIQALELGNFVEARKYLEAANHQYPTSSNLNFLLGYTALQQKEEDHELEYLQTAIKLDSQNIQAQNLLAQLYYKRDDYAKASEAAEVVVARSGDSLLARRILAASSLKLGRYDKARDNAQWLVDHGGSEGASARLILGQALADLGQYKAAIPVLQAYLEAEPTSSVAPAIKKLIGELESDVNAKSGIADPSLTAAIESGNPRAGMPSDIDDQKPTVASGVQCPSNLMQKTGNPSKLLVESVSQYSAVEHLVHENISSQGVPRNRETRQYNYVVSISEPKSDVLHVQEYRDADNLDMPDKITTTGLPVLAIAFHPLFSNDFEMKCEGLGQWNGQATWLVHFRQRDDKPSRLRSYVVNKNYYPVAIKGRAWVSADNFQIVHLETDLVRGIPEIHLKTEHTSVDYGSVQFKKSGADLWLPMNAEMYVSLGNRRFRRSESFDHFMLFATDANEVAKPPKTESTQNPVPNSGPQQNE